MTAPLDVVARMVAAIEAGDADAVKDLYAPDVVLWTNFDDTERGRDDALEMLGALLTHTRERRYDVKRRIEIEGGVLQQHVVRGTTKGGRTFAMPACLVMEIADGRVTRIDEYLDPAAMARSVT